MQGSRISPVFLSMHPQTTHIPISTVNYHRFRKVEMVTENF